MSSPNGHRRTAGFTLLEMLVVMAIAGILLAIVGVALQSSMRNARSSDFIDSLAQDINLARSLAMAKGKKTQIDFVSASAYKVSKLDDAGALIVPPTLPGADLAAMGGLKRRLALGYNRLVATRLGRAAMRAVGPQFHIVATREDGPPPTQPPLRETTP